ncbi:sulfatase [Candidatus Hydrogenedentota bacterium]
MQNHSANGEGRKRPNILILYSDQLRADALSCAGNPCIKTPNIDRLAYEGVRFENAFVSFPLCSPFRASLLTGKYAHSNGQFANHFPVPCDQTFLAEILRDNGYRNGYIGKWHLDGGDKPGFVPPGERRLGFEHFVGFNRGHFYDKSIYYRDTDEPIHCSRHEPDFQTDHLLQFMGGSLRQTDGRPFFAMICYGPPHGPQTAPEHYLELYSPDELPMRSNVEGDDGTINEWREWMARYYGLIANVDYNVGRVLGWLDKAGIADDTIVIFLSDHGEMGGEHGLRGKKVPYDASMRVPLLVRYPSGVQPSRVVSQMVDASVDTMSTILDLCGLPIPEDTQGTSYMSLLNGEDAPTRKEVYYEVMMQKEGPEKFPVPERGVRTLEWLYVRTPQGPKMLFDLVNDPLEMKNLVDDPTYQGIREELDGLLCDHMKRTGDNWEIEAVFPPPNFQTHQDGAETARLLIEKAIIEA